MHQSQEILSGIDNVSNPDIFEFFSTLYCKVFYFLYIFAVQ